MSDNKEVARRVVHYLSRLQSRVLAVENAQSKRPGLHWGQFVMEGQPNSQVGVYGSACAAFILRLARRDDASARSAVAGVEAFLNTSEAELELGHNLKLAMVCLALAPQPGSEASQVLMTQIDTLVGRHSTAVALWPAFSKPAKFSNVQFTERPSEVASALITILVSELRRRLTHQSQQNLCAQLDALLSATASALENAYSAAGTTATRHSYLLATAILVVKGGEAISAVNRDFKDAVRERDFSDRRVFFYDCLREGAGSPSRDYFILPAATLVPLVAASTNASAMQRALALDTAYSLLQELDDDGIFRGGQDLPSTIEQGLIGLSLQAIGEGVERIGIATRIAQGWLYITQSSPTGKPTKLVYVLVFLLWALATVLVVGKYLPDEHRSTKGLGWIYTISKEAPEAVAQFVSFLAAAWPASRIAFMRLIRRDDRS